MRASAIAVWDQAALRLAYLERCQRGAGTGCRDRVGVVDGCLGQGADDAVGWGDAVLLLEGDDRLAGQRPEDPIHRQAGVVDGGQFGLQLVHGAALVALRQDRAVVELHRWSGRGGWLWRGSTGLVEGCFGQRADD